MRFTNKVVIVTGASSGIGADTAELFAKEGANVAIIGRNEANLDNTAARCAQNGNTVLSIKADVSSDDDCKRIIKETIDKFGKLDILINNAGIAKISNVVNENVVEVFDEIMKTNLRAVVVLTSLATPYLIKSKGNIVNVSSIAGKNTILPMVIYGALKSALDHYSRGAALEFAAHGVRVNVVSPGPVWTHGTAEKNAFSMTRDDLKKMTPLSRVMEGEEIGKIILFLASDEAKGITGSDYVADNGASLRNLESHN